MLELYALKVPQASEQDNLSILWSELLHIISIIKEEKIFLVGSIRFEDYFIQIEYFYDLRDII